MVTFQAPASALGGEICGDQVLAPGPGHSAKNRSLSIRPSTDASDGFLANSSAGDDLRVCRDYVHNRLELDPGGRAESNRNGGAFRPAPKVITRRASDIKPEPFAWLWRYWLASGKLHIIAGVPETGKTTIALSYAAIVSSGGKWPDGTRATVGSVLIWTAEDDADDTLVPRLMRMGADASIASILSKRRSRPALSRGHSIRQPTCRRLSKRRRLSETSRC